MKAKLPGGTPETIDLCAFGSEPWLGRSTEDRNVAAFETGRLLHCLDWLLLRGALIGPIDRRLVTFVYRRLRMVAANAFGSDAEAAVKVAARMDFVEWKRWYESQSWETWLAEIREDPTPSTSLPLPSAKTGGPSSGMQQDLFLAQLSHPNAEKIEIWSAEDWRNANQITKELESRWDVMQKLIAELGYHVDDGLRPFHVPRELAVGFAVRSVVTSSSASPYPFWFPRLKPLLQRLGICKRVPKAILKKKPGYGSPEIVDAFDRRIREDLLALSERPGYLGLICSVSGKAVRREGFLEKGPLVLGKDIWIVVALSRAAAGFVARDEMKAIYHDPHKIAGKGEYSGAFPVRINKLNTKLAPLRVKIIGERNDGWRLIDRPLPVARELQSKIT